METRFFARLVWITAAAVLVSIVWQSIPLIQSALLSWQADPRAVTPRGDLAADEKSTIELFEHSRDSVVFITTAERVVDPWTRNAYDVPRGTGSGFVWDALGHVVTNHHVIAGASRAIVGTGRPPPLPIGTSDDLKVGQKVFAIGNPFGLDWTLTTGIVSALDRELPNDEGGVIRELIQTDAAINPGNSGGPLIDSAGRLIGVNTAIFSPSGSNAGIGFSVPVDTVNRVVPQLIALGAYAPPRLGIQYDPRVDAMLARAGGSGVVILGVEPDGPAAQAGLRSARITADGRIIPEDLVIGLGSDEVQDAADLRTALEKYKPGDLVELRILRAGEPERISIQLQR